MQRARVTAQHHPAERGKACGVGLRQRQRIVDADGTGPMHGVPEDAVERRLECQRLVAVEQNVGDAEARGNVEFRRQHGKCRLAPIELEPAAATEVTLGAGFRRERFVFADCARHQRTHQLRGLKQPVGPRRRPESHQPRRNARQIREVIIRHRRTFERDAKEVGKFRRKRRRKDGIAFDNAGIAVGGTLPRSLPIDQRNRHAALGKMQCHRRADHAGPKNDDIRVRQNRPPKPLVNAAGAAPPDCKGARRCRSACVVLRESRP